jgi:hypothetical protein
LVDVVGSVKKKSEEELSQIISLALKREGEGKKGRERRKEVC